MISMSKEDLLKTVVQYLKLQGYNVRENITIETPWGAQFFNFLASSSKSKMVVIVKDWRRTVGINTVIRWDRSASEAGVPNIMIIGPQFSSHAKIYAARRGNITLMPIEKIKTIKLT